MFVDVVLLAATRSADVAEEEEDPPAGRALSMDSVPATTRYTVPAALATRSAVVFKVSQVLHTHTRFIYYKMSRFMERMFRLVEYGNGIRAIRLYSL